MMETLRCRVFGHRWMPARRCPPMVMPTMGLVGGWETTTAKESRGTGCNRCGLYVEHAWVDAAREVTREEP